MSNSHEPETVREAIREGLGGYWTKELEDRLFWPISQFVDRTYRNGYEKGRLDELEDLRRAGILPSAEAKKEMGR